MSVFFVDGAAPPRPMSKCTGVFDILKMFIMYVSITLRSTVHFDTLRNSKLVWFVDEIWKCTEQDKFGTVLQRNSGSEVPLEYSGGLPENWSVGFCRFFFCR